MVIDLYYQVCSYENLYLAYQRARKGKTTKQYVLEFEENLIENLRQLQRELLTQTYQPSPLQGFILRDPKTRKINRSAFRDRIVYHALCIIIEPLFEQHFIFDSYANRKGKGVLRAIDRFYSFQNMVSQNHTRTAFVLKADIRKYFETVPHSILLSIITKRITDPQIMSLINIILSNYTQDGEPIGMPLGNLTSQFTRKDNDLFCAPIKSLLYLGLCECLLE